MRRKQANKLYPSASAIIFHSRLAYPESYTLIRQYWEEMGKAISGQDISSSLYSALIVMGDPEARHLFDKEVAEFIKANGRSEDSVSDFLSFFQYYRNNSYILKKMLATLEVDRKFVRTSEGDLAAFNCEILVLLIDELVGNRTPIGAKIHRATPCEEKFKYEKEIREATQKLIKKREEEERYWMENLPFYKK